MLKKINAARAAVGTAFLTLCVAAHAELPAEAATGIAAYKDDVLEALGMLLAAGIAIYALRKLGQKLGWI